MSHIKDMFKRSRKSSSAKKSDDANNSDKASISDNASMDDADDVSIADTATLAPSIVGASTSARSSIRPTDNNSQKKEPKYKDSKKNRTNFITRAGNLYNSNSSLQTELSGIDPTAGVYY
ncbi:hypothetical protein IW147_001949 [Coemansia sp. RSA 720]|nr:hypothetical protein IW147_001949 [Coemansia sp. RSA 720]